MIIGRIPPCRALRLSGNDPLTIACPPGFLVAMPNVGRLARVADDYLECAIGRDRLCGLDIDVGKASRNGLRGYPIDADLDGVQGQIEVERVEMLGSPCTDRRCSGDGLRPGIPVDHDLVLDHVITTVARLREIRIAESGFSVSGVRIKWGRRRYAARKLPQPVNRPSQAERCRHNGQQDHRHDYREYIGHAVGSLHCRLLRKELRWLRSHERLWLLRWRPPRVNARHAPGI